MTSCSTKGVRIRRWAGVVEVGSGLDAPEHVLHGGGLGLGAEAAPGAVQLKPSHGAGQKGEDDVPP